VQHAVKKQEMVQVTGGNRFLYFFSGFFLIHY
jgi:hypothetical protein